MHFKAEHRVVARDDIVVVEQPAPHALAALAAEVMHSILIGRRSRYCADVPILRLGNMSASAAAISR